MRSASAIAVVLALIASADIARATNDGRQLLYGGGGQGKVIFDGRTHAAAGFVCNDCHLGIFETRKKALITSEDHKNGKACFACHNGTGAFNECGTCHRP
ncbi:MAG TPA: cytochrome c3 family protein [Nitrospirota bacterium]|nr:cytochrome c3 family protein [Nitrospirota bacterium]